MACFGEFYAKRFDYFIVVFHCERMFSVLLRILGAMY
jgi:hypothetical protein